METEPKDLIVLGVIMRGEKKFDKIKKITQTEASELNSILEKLERRGFITVQEKKGLFGPKIEIVVTEKGAKEVDERIFELHQKWDQMSLLLAMRLPLTNDAGTLNRPYGPPARMLI